MDDANLELAIEGVLWGAFGTTGQRCTATSRLILHEKIDHTVGIEILVRPGDYIEKNQPWCRILYRSKETLYRAKEILNTAIFIDTKEAATKHASIATERYTSFEEP